MDEKDMDGEKVRRLKDAMYSRTLSEQLKERERRALMPQRSVVGDDFMRPERALSGKTMAPRAIGWIRTFLWWCLAAAIIFCLGAGAVFGYYFTLGGGSTAATSQNIDIEITGPSQLTGGQTSELQMVVTNHNSSSLELADLVITYPQGTRSPTDYATDLPTQRISLGTIEPGGVRRGTVSAVFAGKEGDHVTVKVELEYHLSGSNAIYVASNTYDSIFSSSPLSIAVAGNTQTISGQPIQMVVTVSSNATTPLKDVLLSAVLPFGFTLSSADPKASHDTVWELGDLSPGQSKAVTIVGTMAGDKGDQRVVNFTAGTRKTPTGKSIDTVISSNAYAVTITEPFLDLSLSINKASSGSSVVSPGDTVSVSINYQNNLTTAVTDAVLVARLSGIEIDGTTVRSTNGFFRSTDDTVYWDKTTTKNALADLAPGAKGTADFTFQIPSSAVLNKLKNPYLSISINAAGNRVSETNVPESLQSSLAQRINIASDLQITANGLYYTNPFGSTGPMPPTSNKETTYAMVFTITNTTNKIAGATVTALLPPYVRWTGTYSPSTENITFNPVTSTFTWKVGDIDPGVGVGGTAPRQAAVSIGFTPSTSQIGQQPPLVQNVTLNGVDAATGAPVQRIASDPTTNITGDQGFSSSNATVVK